MKVIGSVYHGGGKDGDFGWMIQQSQYDDAFFVFNDNEEQYKAHRDDPTSSYGCAAGGGNAGIRPYQCKTPPRAAGVPTGVNGVGYSDLSPAVKAVIDDAIGVIKKETRGNAWKRLIYSGDGAGGLGTGIFHVADDVKAYIVKGLEALGDGT